MAYRVRATIYIDLVADGTGGVMLGQQQAENPGYTSAQTTGPVGVAQTLSYNLAELVPGGDSPTASNFQTALTAIGTDAYTIANTAGSLPGLGSTSPIAIAQGWATGNP